VSASLAAGGRVVRGHDRTPLARTGTRSVDLMTTNRVSGDYYTRLEKGNLSGVSDTVLEAIAVALQLDEAERQHLLNLA
jgi:hypothetical protein